MFDNDYKHPVVLAKELATVDVLSGGRVEVGLGAGWMNTDYEQSGIPMESPGVRVSRMEEGIAVLKGCFAPGPFSYEGEHYTITGYDSKPKPVQSPPPLLIGGGAKRVLSHRRAGRPRSSASTPRSTAARWTPRPPRAGPPSRPTRRWPG